MPHLELITKDTPKPEAIVHEGFDFIHYWLARPECDIFEILTLYREHRKELLIKQNNADGN